MAEPLGPLQQLWQAVNDAAARIFPQPQLPLAPERPTPKLSHPPHLLPEDPFDRLQWAELKAHILQTTFPDLPNLPLAPPTYVEGVNEAAVAEMHAAAKQLQAALYELELARTSSARGSAEGDAEGSGIPVSPDVEAELQAVVQGSQDRFWDAATRTLPPRRSRPGPLALAAAAGGAGAVVACAGILLARALLHRRRGSRISRAVHGQDGQAAAAVVQPPAECAVEGQAAAAAEQLQELVCAEVAGVAAGHDGASTGSYSGAEEPSGAFKACAAAAAAAEGPTEEGAAEAEKAAGAATAVAAAAAGATAMNAQPVAVVMPAVAALAASEAWVLPGGEGVAPAEATAAAALAAAAAEAHQLQAPQLAAAKVPAAASQGGVLHGGEGAALGWGASGGAASPVWADAASMQGSAEDWDSAADQLDTADMGAVLMADSAGEEAEEDASGGDDVQSDDVAALDQHRQYGHYFQQAGCKEAAMAGGEEAADVGRCGGADQST